MTAESTKSGRASTQKNLADYYTNSSSIYCTRHQIRLSADLWRQKRNMSNFKTASGRQHADSVASQLNGAKLLIIHKIAPGHK